MYIRDSLSSKCVTSIRHLSSIGVPRVVACATTHVMVRTTLLILGVSLISCGGGRDKCSACGTGFLCDPQTGECVAKMSNTCVPGCMGITPVCDTGAALGPKCVVCTATAGCGGFTPRCDISTLGGRCVASSNDGGTGGGSAGTGGGSASTGGGSGGGGTRAGGGTNTGGGSGGSTGGSTGAGGGTAGSGGSTGTGGSGGGYTTFGDPYFGLGSCAPQDAGVVGGSCVPNCNEGFQCLGGQCVLNGGGGPVQVTLRWNTTEDLDLHVSEPKPNGTTCEIDYTDPNNDPQDPSSCGALGSLDLDSEAGCAVDHVDIENIIYPPGSSAPRGVYKVWVDHYANCDPALTMVPFELEARFNGQSAGVCGVFVPTDSDWDNSNVTNGRYVMTFFVP